MAQNDVGRTVNIKWRSQSFLLNIVELGILAVIYSIVAGTYGITRFLTMRELGLSEMEIDGDKRAIQALIHMVVAALAAAAFFAVAAYLHRLRRDEDAA